MSRIPGYRPGPLGIQCPLNWRDDVTGELPSAVKAYLDNRIDQKPVTRAQLDLLRDYFEHYINAPCWDDVGAGEFTPELTALRASVKTLKSADDFAGWIHGCLEIGCDPL